MSDSEEPLVWLWFTHYSTTVIVKIKGKPRSFFFYNKRTVIGKLMHIIIDIKYKSVELISENNDVLVNFIS